MKDLERQIQDYLDGRLDDAARAAFERRLAGDEALARRCAAYVEIGGALREGDDALPPGFHARLQSAFAQRYAVRRRFPLTWEAMGLAAAILVAAALFLPPLLRRDIAPEPSPESSNDVPAASTRRADESSSSQDDVFAEPETGTVAPSEPPDREAAPARRQPDAKLGSSAAEQTEVAGAATASRPAPAPGAAEPETAPIAAPIAGRGRQEMDDLSAGARLAPASTGVALPAGAVPAGEWIVADDEATWARLLATPAGPLLVDLRGERRDVRVLVVGPRTPAWSCDGSVLVRRTGGWTVTPAGGDDLGGCAFLVPADGTAVVETPP